MNFEIVETNKLGGTWQQQFVVVRKNVVYLRIVGDGTNYRVMTATVGDDDRGYRLCPNEERLWAAAGRLAKQHRCEGEAAADQDGRKYIQIFTVSQPKPMSDKEFTDEFMVLIDEFFAVFDGLQNDPSDLQEIHRAISDGDDEEVYLEGGVTLDSNGDLRGRLS